MKISQLPKATVVNDADIVPIVQDGETKQIPRKTFVGTVPDGLKIQDNTLHITESGTPVGDGVEMPITPDGIQLSNNKLQLTAKGEAVGNGVELPEITVDAELSDISENAVQNKAVKTYIDGKKINMIIDCPAFTNQPTINEAELNSAFVPWNVNYYYVHIVDSATGTFKLMTAYNDTSSCIDQTFTLSGLNTGNSGVLKENSLVDFLTVGENWQMRSAGVSRVGFSLLNSNYISLTFNGFSDMSGYMHVLSITGVNNNDYCCATGTLTTIYNGSSGFLFGTTQYRKNILVSCNLDITVQSKYIDFSGNYFYKKLAENKRDSADGSKFGRENAKGVLYKTDLGLLPITKIKDFFLLADGLFLNGTELTAVGKERF